MAAAKERNSNIELLRIISMGMVLILHCLSATGALDYLSGINYWVYRWLEAVTIIAVNVFVIISGYFMISSSFKVSRVLKIWGMDILHPVLSCGLAGEWANFERGILDKNAVSAIDEAVLVCEFVLAAVSTEPVSE